MCKAEIARVYSKLLLTQQGTNHPSAVTLWAEPTPQCLFINRIWRYHNMWAYIGSLLTLFLTSFIPTARYQQSAPWSFGLSGQQWFRLLHEVHRKTNSNKFSLLCRYIGVGFEYIYITLVLIPATSAALGKLIELKFRFVELILRSTRRNQAVSHQQQLSCTKYPRFIMSKNQRIRILSLIIWTNE